MQTPFFPALRPTLAPMGSRTAKVYRRVRSYTLCKLEERFGSLLPKTLFPKATEKANSRECPYNQWRTFWCMLWQGLNPGASGRQVVRQLQALFALLGRPTLSEEDGAYCRAKARLPLGEFAKALQATAQAADEKAPALSLLQKRRLLLADGSTLTMADTPENRQAFPPVQCPEPNFPMMRIVVLFSVLSGAILSLVTGDMRCAELPMLNQLLTQLVAGDILVGDRGFGNYILLALLHQLKAIDFIGRAARKSDGRRRLKRLGKNDWFMVWKKSSNPSLWLPRPQWLQLPNELTVRIVRANCYAKGFRVRQLTLVTTLLDPQQYPAQEILQAYLRRWRLEMCLDDLKTTLELDMLRSKSPQMVQREIHAHLIGHNLVRYTMTEAASEHSVPLDRLSFKGTLDALRQFTQAMSQARTNKKRQQIWAELLGTVAADLVPDRPGRREPRAVKRVKRRYPRLNVPRHQFTDRPKRNVRRAISRRKNKGLR